MYPAKISAFKYYLFCLVTMLTATFYACQQVPKDRSHLKASLNTDRPTFPFMPPIHCKGLNAQSAVRVQLFPMANRRYAGRALNAEGDLIYLQDLDWSIQDQSYPHSQVVHPQVWVRNKQLNLFFSPSQTDLETSPNTLLSGNLLPTQMHCRFSLASNAPQLGEQLRILKEYSVDGLRSISLTVDEYSSKLSGSMRSLSSPHVPNWAPVLNRANELVGVLDLSNSDSFFPAKVILLQDPDNITAFNQRLRINWAPNSPTASTGISLRFKELMVRYSTGAAPCEPLKK